MEADAGSGPAGPSEEDPMYRLLVDCNQLAVDIDNELVLVHNYIRDRYRLRFPELDSLVQHPIDYARVAKAIGNEIDITNVDLDAVLPQVCRTFLTCTSMHGVARLSCCNPFGLAKFASPGGVSMQPCIQAPAMCFNPVLVQHLHTFIFASHMRRSDCMH